MRGVFWMAFNKLYNKNDFKKNFEGYFNYTGEKPNYYINAEKYIKYLSDVPMHKLYGMS